MGEEIMSLYQFAPAPSFGIGDEPFVTWDDGFTDEEIERIIKYSNNKRFSEAAVGGFDGAAPSDIRVSKVTWLDNNADTAWLYDKLAYIVRRLNGQFYQYDLYGFSEDFQFTVYEGSQKGHYDWHQDSSPNTDIPRKLSVVLQLSSPDDYEGGELELKTGGKTDHKIIRKKGFITAFPSYQLHRVTPVTSGTRISLVAWVGGPKFR